MTVKLSRWCARATRWRSGSITHGLRREVKDEFDAWLLIPEVQQVNATPPIDPLAWWKLHDSLFPRVSKLARKYLAIPASSAPSERVFSREAYSTTSKVEFSPSATGGMRNA